MNELSLFTGAGGGLLGTKLLGWKHIGYVEIEPYCQKVLAQRIKDGILDNAPIFTDIRAFIDSGCAELYRGVADVITAGVPCPPWSIAGKNSKGLGMDDVRNLFPETLQAIRIIRPQFAFLKNVANILVHRYFGLILTELSQMGYCVRYCCLSAGNIGAIHRRDRIWILAYSQGNGCEYSKHSEDRSNRGKSRETVSVKGIPFGNKEMYHEEIRTTEFVRTANGIPNRVDRIKAIGNGQVPIVVKTVWKLLAGKGEKW